MLSNKGFLLKAPKEKVALEKEKYETYKAQLHKVNEQLENLNNN